MSDSAATMAGCTTTAAGASASTADALKSLTFARRKESWVGQSAGHFYKIVRKGDDPLRDLDDPACIDTAAREYADMRFLASLDDAVCRPERIEGACIVYPPLGGPDLRTLLLGRAAATGQRDAALRSAMRLLARLHRGGTADYPVKDYRFDGFLAPGPEVLDAMQRRRRTLVVTGFEARNFRFDAGRATWFFFDPHHLWAGYPEEDLARFVISLLMLPGRRRGPRVWKDFDRFRLLQEYERAAPARLDRRLLNWFLSEELAKRRFHALKLARRMPAGRRIFAVIYTRMYYRWLRRALAFQQF